jgi:hypothetical protein
MTAEPHSSDFEPTTTAKTTTIRTCILTKLLQLPAELRQHILSYLLDRSRLYEELEQNWRHINSSGYSQVSQQILHHHLSATSWYKPLSSAPLPLKLDLDYLATNLWRRTLNAWQEELLSFTRAEAQHSLRNHCQTSFALVYHRTLSDNELDARMARIDADVRDDTAMKLAWDLFGIKDRIWRDAYPVGSERSKWDDLNMSWDLRRALLFRIRKFVRTGR